MHCFFFVGSQAQTWFFHEFSVAGRGDTAILCQLKLLTADSFHVQEENGLESIFSCSFRRLQSRFDTYIAVIRISLVATQLVIFTDALFQVDACF